MFETTSVLVHRAPADADALRSFNAGAELARIRSGLLVALQDTVDASDLNAAIRDLQLLNVTANAAGLDEISPRLVECGRLLADIRDFKCSSPERNARLALDRITEIEASLFRSSLQDDEHHFDITGFLDASFERLTQGDFGEPVLNVPESDGGFEIDEETLEIFRTEASELLESVSANLHTLTVQPDNLDALWNIRRCAHTFKGAAGIVGLNEASALAHRVEDLLDQLAKDQYEADADMIELLGASTEHLRSMVFGCGTSERLMELSALYDGFDRVLKDNAAGRAVLTKDRCVDKQTSDARQNSVQTAKPMPAPVARVALDRLDELLNLTRNLAMNRSLLAKELSMLSSDNTAQILERIGPLFEAQRQLTNEIQDRLLCIRMVRFGMLATRLNRAVHVTCQEENKKAELVIDNEDFEIDTQMLDSLVEPLLHLLRNAVVHGIEPPERRRLIGKPEKAQIRIEVGSVADEVTLSVCDDGRGISTSKLREKAVTFGVMDRGSAEALTEAEALDLMFLRGITTANNLSLNAGRGVGMSIVKESIGSIGGTISVAAEPQRGTIFTIKLPLVIASALDFADVGDQFFSESAAPDMTNGLTVLIVDDSSSMRQLLTRMIERAGWKTIAATDGRSAVEILRESKSRPDIILTDLEMPNMDGYELLEFLKADDQLRDIPVVMITSRTGEEHKQKAFALGVVDFITKPFSEDALIRAIQRTGAQAACLQRRLAS